MKSGATGRLGLALLTALIVVAAGHLVAPPGLLKSSGFASQGDVLIASSGAAELPTAPPQDAPAAPDEGEGGLLDWLLATWDNARTGAGGRTWQSATAGW